MPRAAWRNSDTAYLPAKSDTVSHFTACASRGPPTSDTLARKNTIHFSGGFPTRLLPLKFVTHFIQLLAQRQLSAGTLHVLPADGRLADHSVPMDVESRCLSCRVILASCIPISFPENTIRNKDILKEFPTSTSTQAEATSHNFTAESVEPN